MNDALAGYLRRVAASGATTTYQQVAARCSLNLTSANDRTTLARLLREISTAEHAAGRPLLTAVVVLRGRGTPGRGFFELARHLAWIIHRRANSCVDAPKSGTRE